MAIYKHSNTIRLPLINVASGYQKQNVAQRCFVYRGNLADGKEAKVHYKNQNNLDNKLYKIIISIISILKCP